MSHSHWEHHEFDAVAEEDQLAPLISEMVSTPPVDEKAWRTLLRKYPKHGKTFFAKAEVLAGFRALKDKHHWQIDEEAFLRLLKMKPNRTRSGVTPVTVLTKPYPCPGQCIFCPNDVRMPKSYLSEEPGALQAAMNRFDPYVQTWNRVLAYYRMGHPVEKVELIVLGGTWSSYPEAIKSTSLRGVFRHSMILERHRTQAP